MAEVATLEGLTGSGGARSCLSVKTDKNGMCRCARFGAPGEGPGFKQLCATKNLPIGFGSKRIERKGEDTMANLALDEIDDVDDIGDSLAEFLGLEGPFLDPVMLKTSAVVAGGGAAAAVGLGLLLKSATVSDYLKDDKGVVAPWKKILIAAGVGILAGRLLWDKNRALAFGILGAAGGVVGAEVYGMLTKEPLAGFGFLGAEPEEIPIAYLGDGEEEEPELLGQPIVEQRQLLGEASVETRRPELADIGSWIS